jgi:hypothetical protein
LGHRVFVGVEVADGDAVVVGVGAVVSLASVVTGVVAAVVVDPEAEVVDGSSPFEQLETRATATITDVQPTSARERFDMNLHLSPPALPACLSLASDRNPAAVADRPRRAPCR